MNDSDAVQAAISATDIWSFPGSLSDYIYRLLSPGNMTSWEAFATTENRDGSPTDFMSLEDIHNYIHVSSSIYRKLYRKWLILLGCNWRHGPSSGSHELPTGIGIRSRLLAASLVICYLFQ